MNEKLPKLKIRPYLEKDAERIGEIFAAAINGLGPHDYTPDQVRVWAARRPNAEQAAARANDGRTTWVAANTDDEAMAFIDLEADGHIDLLYAHPHVAGTGIAAALYAQLESSARAAGLTMLYTEASERARRFFAKQGFELGDRQEIDLDGVTIHNFRMRKALD